MREPVLIVGAGLSGLHTASLLAARGISCNVLEARGRIGGRVLSEAVPERPEIGTFDLGPTWFWPQYEPVIAKMVERFGLQTIEQHTEGAVLLERSPNEPIQKGFLPEGAVERSVRLVGGMQALVDAIAHTLPTSTVETNTRVTAIEMKEEGDVAIETSRTDGTKKRLHAGTVILALPPRMIAEQITFSPDFSDTFMSNLMATPTWMAEQAKAIVVYDRPFWQEEGLSGQAMSWGTGPLQEIHDASPETGYGALFGFFSLSAKKRRELGEENVRHHVIKQLMHLFGPAAAKPISFLYKDWAVDVDTTVNADIEPGRSFPGDRRPPILEAWKKRLLFSSTEMSSSHGGHLEGALRAAEHVVSEVLHTDKT